MSSLSRHLAALPSPPPHNLNSHFILSEIIDHISLLEEDFPHVDIFRLKQHLWRIRNCDVDPESHLRGFLKVFEKTDAFKDAFEGLDEGMKRQLHVFMAGGSREHVMAVGREHGAFALPPSPPVKRHFESMVQKVEEFLSGEKSHDHVHETNGQGHSNGDANGVNGTQFNGQAHETNGHGSSVSDTLESNGHVSVTNGLEVNGHAHASGINGTQESNGHNDHEHCEATGHFSGANDVLESNGHLSQTNDDENREINNSYKGNVDALMANGDNHETNGSSNGVKDILNEVNDHLYEVKDLILDPNGRANGAKDVVHEANNQTHENKGLIQKLSSHVHEEKWPAPEVNEQDEKLIDPVKPLSKPAPKEGTPKIFENEAGTKTMEVYGNRGFENWGQSVQNTPRWTFVPKTVLGLQNLVKWAKVNNKRVRCSGYRHSWSHTFSQDDQILVSLLNLEEVNKLPDPMSIKPEYIDPENELKTITLATPQGVVASSAEKALVRVGAAVTNEQFRRWAVANDQWTMPVDVILVEVTWGGVNGPICHGAGRAHGTVNDYVRAIEFVDANGVHRTVSDPEHLKAAAGCFGLLGVVTHITFELDKMRYAVMQPVKPDIGLAIPPMSRDDIPVALMKTFSQKQYDDALRDFEDRAENHYYAEWFWFTRSQQAWVNTWNPTTDKTDVEDYPSPILTWFQWVEGWLGAVITSNPIFQAMPGRWQAEILATFGMVALPPFEFSPDDFQQNKAKTIKTALPNALHFRRGIQNMRVRDLEFQIPIPSLPTDPSKPDWSVVRRAWWDIINLCYESDSCPMRLTMELRIMGSSSLLMAPQNGNAHGTASIEVLSIPDAVSDDEWQPFLQKVADLWMSYRDAEGRQLNVRPHWAKEWESVMLRGMPAKQYLKERAYGEKIPVFKRTLESIGKGQGWELGDLKERFSNELWDYLIFE